METQIKNKIKLTAEQQTELAGLYDTLAIFFGGDELEPIKEVCGGYNNIQYYNILKALDKKLTWWRTKSSAPYLKLIRTKTDKFITKEIWS